MNDLLTWFVGRHTLIAAILFPEFSFVYAIWMRMVWPSVVLGLIVIFKQGLRMVLTGCQIAREMSGPLDG